MKNLFRTTGILTLVLFVAVLLGATAPVIACGGGRGGRGSCHKDLWTTLTLEQREAVIETIKEMKEAGATCSEIRTAVREIIVSFGIELSDSCGGCHGRRECGHAPGECDSSCTGSRHRRGGCGRHGSGCGGHSDRTYFSVIKDNEETTPSQITINKIIPNPFNSTTQIMVAGDIHTGQNINIYNMDGRLIRTIPLTNKSIIWDGADENGQKVGTGTYFVRIDSEISSQKVILIK